MIPRTAPAPISEKGETYTRIIASLEASFDTTGVLVHTNDYCLKHTLGEILTLKSFLSASLVSRRYPFLFMNKEGINDVHSMRCITHRLDMSASSYNGVCGSNHVNKMCAYNRCSRRVATCSCVHVMEKLLYQYVKGTHLDHFARIFLN